MVKLPDNAKCVFKGVMFDVYQWQQEMFDGSFQTFEAIKRLPSVQIIAVTKDKKIVMQKESQPFMGTYTAIPGGRVDRGSGYEETAKNELLEETGMKAENWFLWCEKQVGSKVIWPTYYYIAKGCELIQGIQNGEGERTETIPVSFNEFFRLAQSENFKNKQLSDMLFRIQQDEEKLHEFKSLLFE
ncbi:MAG: NUDIX hydrolase [Nanoarchaeota archaeon]